MLTGGVDLTEVPGFGSYSALQLISEFGLDMSRWTSPDSKSAPFTAFGNEKSPSASTSFRLTPASSWNHPFSPRQPPDKTDSFIGGRGGTSRHAVRIGGWAWDRSVAELEARIKADEKPLQSLAREDLPSPVARSFARAIPENTEQIVGARLTQEGTFQMGEGPAGWRAFTAVEFFRTSDPAFYWDARIAMAPAVPVRVLDSYIDGEARMLGEVLGLIPVVNASSEPGLLSGALARYLAEAVWIPRRLASGPGLSWEAVDDRSADATLADGGTVVTLRFTFDQPGDPLEVEGIRAREVDGVYVDTPWLGRFADHRDMGGFRIPTYGEVAWLVDGVEFLYWRGTITAAEFATEPSPYPLPTATR